MSDRELWRRVAVWVAVPSLVASLILAGFVVCGMLGLLPAADVGSGYKFAALLGLAVSAALDVWVIARRLSSRK
jgi:uncharacterized membrane protein